MIGVAGSIAAVETPRIVRELIRHGATVHAVMSADATRIVTAEALRFATGEEVVTQLSGDVEHVSMMGPGESRADLLLIAPATANTLSKMAHGIDDTPVTSFASVALGGKVPVLVAPAMHGDMAQNPAVVANLERLRSFGVGIIAPIASEGEEKIATPEEVAAAVLHRLARGPWVGKRVLVIGGASHEPIDDVRTITNQSSGETAIALAAQSHYRGAETTLWLGGAQVVAPSFLPLARWKSVRDLLQLVRDQRGFIHRADAVWVPAALSDFTTRPRRGKISSRSADHLDLRLSRSPRVLPELRRRIGRGRILVGFKLESGATEASLEERARELIRENRLDFAVANDRASLDRAETRVRLVPARGESSVFEGEKSHVAGELVDFVGRSLAPRGRGAGGRGAS